ncbi:class I SAM-dependent methyltransferase [Frankia sp. CNm7]|uniref:Class I SAM-dependent methyltransferase n=1 Tax=Frankia nepalensis TaxID=1836974 RepID=A0A937R755_9ACTN|nr:class I SAM-dependent methyltransferase [Frankia nepalensis]MBL7502639.1 class I SAM-dependent methyltransferase [Frankia nepalensis]MBL7514851.1 class I SAM-dependent methyltransferase [Frankia nepalensis]MBL7520880.1 class I SAM-dependent methyltransferase [Frankia nepalensis]MBL7626541.1 class I SAM-dependent methyltransferase [Frankia nepalensis]
MKFDAVGKVSLEHVYNQPDPRAYFRTLRALDYRLPQLAKPYFSKIMDECRESRPDRRLRVLDVGCSYGVNAALLKFDVAIDELYDRYAGEIGRAVDEPGGSHQDHDRGSVDGPTPAATGTTGLAADPRTRATLVASDRALATARGGVTDLEVIGLDAAGPALAYALDAGFLDDALHADLESREPTEPERARLAGVDLVISTGCLGYVTGRTLSRIVTAAAGPDAAPGSGEAAGGGGPGLPWMAHFTLRMFPFDPIAETLAGFGYQTVAVDRFFEQRRFASRRERDQVLTTLAGIGVDPRGLEADGWLYAQLFISRPPEFPLDIRSL